jgi:hypothetical protein
MSIFNAQELTIYTQASDPIILGVGKRHYREVSIQVHAGTGSVLIEQWDLDAGDWFVPDGPEHTIIGTKTVIIQRVNRPPLRIRATGNAKFAFFGDVR